MQHGDGRGLVVARAVTLATTSLAVSAAAHVLGGGSATPGPVFVGAGALLLAGALPLARRSLRPVSLLGYSTLAQLTLHVVVGWLHPVSGTQVAVAGHHGLETATAAAAHAGHAVIPMVLAHAVGTLLTVLLAVGADRSAAVVRAGWHIVLAVLTPAAPISFRRSGVPAAPGAVRHVTHLLAHTLARRGPPAVLTA